MSFGPPDQGSAAAAPQTPAVLVASDDAFLGGLLDALLTDAGYCAVQFATGAALLERLRSDAAPCVALLSLRWPPLTSRAILTTVAAEPALAARHAYILLTTRYDMLHADELALLRQLAVPVVPKPFDINTLLEAVARAVARLTGG
jgi:CheY-like chemotaxis protein